MTKAPIHVAIYLDEINDPTTMRCSCGYQDDETCVLSHIEREKQNRHECEEVRG